eukprot:8807204-Alexandrium_andersonii.AAC.1
MRPHFAGIVDAGGIQYDSNNLKRDMSTEGLATHSPLLASLLDVDPRGGFFDHAHVVGAIRSVCNAPTSQPKAVLMAGRVG